MSQSLKVGRLLRANTIGFVFGCHVSQSDAPEFGSLVRVALDETYQVYGIIHDINIDDDGIVRQLVTAGNVDETVIADNRLNRTIPLEVSVLSIGYEVDNRIYHQLPPRPPLSLDVIHLCSFAEIRDFTTSGNFGYFRHLIDAKDLSIIELLAAHIQQANKAHTAVGEPGWQVQAAQELITLLRDDYTTLMTLLRTMGDVMR